MTFSSSHEKQSHLFTIGLIVLTLGLLTWLFSNFIGIFVGAVALGVAFYPMSKWLEGRFPAWPASLRAGIMNLAVVLFLVLPLFLMMWAAVEQSESWKPVVNDWGQNVQQLRAGNIVESNASVRSLSRWLNNKFAIKPSEFRLQIIHSVNRVLESISTASAVAASNLFETITALGLMVFALFFVFRDGEKMWARFEDYLPLRQEQKAECKERGRLIITGVIRGWLFGAILQGLVATCGYLMCGVKGWIAWGLLTMIAALLPIVGTVIVWAPLAIGVFIHGEIGQGTFLVAWGCLVSVIDNIARPYLVGKDSKVSFAPLMFALIGGISLWGFKGVILGPLLVAIAPVIFDIYRKRYIGTSEVPPPFTETRRDSGFFVADGLQRREIDHVAAQRETRDHRQGHEEKQPS